MSDHPPLSFYKPGNYVEVLVDVEWVAARAFGLDPDTGALEVIPFNSVETERVSDPAHARVGA